MTSNNRYIIRQSYDDCFEIYDTLNKKILIVNDDYSHLKEVSDLLNSQYDLIGLLRSNNRGLKEKLLELGVDWVMDCNIEPTLDNEVELAKAYEEIYNLKKKV